MAGYTKLDPNFNHGCNIKAKQGIASQDVAMTLLDKAWTEYNTCKLIAY